MSPLVTINSFLSIILVTDCLHTSKYIQCYTALGSDTTGGQSKSTASCNSSYSLTSCGADREGSPDDFQGSNPVRSVCEAYSARSFARCCKLTDYGSSFTVESDKSASSTNTVTVSCTSSTDVVIGCGVDTAFSALYAGSIGHIDNATYCTAASTSTSIYAFTHCYDTSTMPNRYNMQCISVWSDHVSGYNATVLCPNHADNYFMTSCTAYLTNTSIESYTIQNNICIATRSQSVMGEPDIVANAICCRMTQDEALSTSTLPTTSNPTLNPTFNPSFSPTEATMDPIVNPPFDPSSNPTVSPSLQSTLSMDDITTSIMDNNVQYKSNVLRVFFIIIGIIITGCVCMVFTCCQCYKWLNKDPSGYRVGSMDSTGRVNTPRAAPTSVFGVNNRYGRKPVMETNKTVELEMSVNKTRAMSFEQREDDHEDSLQHGPMPNVNKSIPENCTFSESIDLKTVEDVFKAMEEREIYDHEDDDVANPYSEGDF